MMQLYMGSNKSYRLQDNKLKFLWDSPKLHFYSARVSIRLRTHEAMNQCVEDSVKVCQVHKCTRYVGWKTDRLKGLDIFCFQDNLCEVRCVLDQSQPKHPPTHRRKIAFLSLSFCLCCFQPHIHTSLHPPAGSKGSQELRWLYLCPLSCQKRLRQLFSSW